MHRNRFSFLIRVLLIAAVLLANVISPMGVKTVQAAGPTGSGATPTAVTVGQTVNIGLVYTSTKGYSAFDRIYLAFTSCNLAQGEAYSSNFERTLSNYFGLLVYDPKSSTPSNVGIYRTNPGSSCTGGIAGPSPITYYYTNTPNVWNANNTLRYNSFSASQSGNKITFYANVTFGTNFPPGTYYYYYMANDGEWNDNGPVWTKVGSITVYPQPGPASVTCNPSGWTSGNVTCSATSANAHHLQYRTNATANGAMTAWTDGSSYTAQYPGTVYFRGVSGSGATGTEGSKYAYVDKTAPTAPGVTCTPGGWTNGNVTCSVTTNSTDVGSGVSYYQYSTNGSTWTNGTSYTRTSAGYVYFRAVDGVGRAGASGSDYAYIDKTPPPAPSVSCVPASGTWTTGNVSCTVSGGVDPESGLMGEANDYQYSRDGSAWSYITGDSQSGKDTITITDRGYVYFRSVNGAGLAGTSTSTYARINQGPTGLGLSATSIAENRPAGTTVGTLSVTDVDSGYGDSFTYSLVSGTGSADNASFSISGNTLKTAASFNYEAKSSYSIRLRVTDGGGKTYEKAFTITVTDVDEGASSLNLSGSSVDENQPIGTQVGTFSATDPDGGSTFTYALVSGEGSADNASFNITGDTLKTAAIFDYEQKSSYSIRVRVTDQGGQTLERIFTITVGDVNEGPFGLALYDDETGSTAETIPENTPAGAVVAEFAASDPDMGDTLTYSLVSGEGDADNDRFMISGNQLLVLEDIDYETKSSYTLRAQVSDGALTEERFFTLEVVDLNEAPYDLELSAAEVQENAPAGTPVGILSASDPDGGDSLSFSLVSGEGDADNLFFHINGDSLETGAAFDYEAKSSYSIRVRAADRGGLVVERALVIQITDVNETPTDFSLSNSVIDEKLPPETTVGVFTATDPDAGDTFTYSLEAGEGDTDNALFATAGDALQTAAVLNADEQAAYSIRVRLTDSGGLWVEKVMGIQVIAVDEPPTDIELSNAAVAENQPTGTLVGELSATDPDAGDSHRFELAEGEGDTDNALFQINGERLETAEELDFETRQTYSIRVRAVDSDGMSLEKVFLLAVIDLREFAPTAVILVPPTILEDSPVGTVVGALVAADPDAGDSHVFSLVSGEGDEGNSLFTIEDGLLKTAAVFEISNPPTYTVRVRAVDLDGRSVEQVVEIRVIDSGQLEIDFSAETYTLPETGLLARIEVSLEHPITDTVEVSYFTEGDTARPGLDYEDVSGVLTFAPGETEASFTVPVTNTIWEDGERSVLLFLENPVGAVIHRGQAELRITDDDDRRSFSVDFRAGEPVKITYGLQPGLFSVHFGGFDEFARLQVDMQLASSIPIPADLADGDALFEAALVDPHTGERLAFGQATLCLPYEEGVWLDYGPTEKYLRLLQYRDDTWTDITRHFNLAQKQVCGTVTDLSAFALAGGETPVGDAILRLVPGQLEIEATEVDFGTVSLDGTAQVIPGELTAWIAIDATGSGAGWHIEVTASDFRRVGDPSGYEKTIPVAGLRIALDAAGITTLAGNSPPASLLGGFTALSATQPLTIASAPAGQGMGRYALLPAFTLTIPPSVYMGQYQSVLTVSMVSGP